MCTDPYCWAGRPPTPIPPAARRVGATCTSLLARKGGTEPHPQPERAPNKGPGRQQIRINLNARPPVAGGGGGSLPKGGGAVGTPGGGINQQSG